VTYRQVVKGLTVMRAEILADFVAHGGNRDRWQARDLRAMADAVSRAEDRLELEMRGRWTTQRAALRAVRRVCEEAVRER